MEVHAMKSATRTLVAAGSAALLGITACSGQEADPADFPTEDVTLVVPYDAGGNVDTQARALGQCFEDQWDVSVLIENRPGSAGAIGTRYVANQDPDGHTLSVNSVSPSVVVPRMLDTVDYTTEDLSMFGHVSAAPILLFVDGDSEHETLDDVVEESRNGHIVAATPGADSIQALLAREINTVHEADMAILPTDSTSEIVRGVTEDDYDIGITATSLDLVPRLESGEVNLVARGGDESYEHFSDAPTLDEAGYGDVLPYTDISIPLIGPGGVPNETATIIETTLEGCLEQPEVIEGIGEELLAPDFINSEQVLEEYAVLGEAIDELS